MPKRRWNFAFKKGGRRSFAQNLSQGASRRGSETISSFLIRKMIFFPVILWPESALIGNESSFLLAKYKKNVRFISHISFVSQRVSSVSFFFSLARKKNFSGDERDMRCGRDGRFPRVCHFRKNAKKVGEFFLQQW